MHNVIRITRIYGLMAENGPQTSNGICAAYWFIRIIEQNTITKKSHRAWEGIIAVEDLLQLLAEGGKIKQVKGGTVNNATRKANISSLKMHIAKLEQELHKLRQDCPHKIVRVRDSAYCPICQRWFGWWCPESPNHRYEYTIESGEYCIYCGQPDERK